MHGVVVHPIENMHVVSNLAVASWYAGRVRHDAGVRFAALVGVVRAAPTFEVASRANVAAVRVPYLARQ